MYSTYRLSVLNENTLNYLLVFPSFNLSAESSCQPLAGSERHFCHAPHSTSKPLSLAGSKFTTNHGKKTLASQITYLSRTKWETSYQKLIMCKSCIQVSRRSNSLTQVHLSNSSGTIPGLLDATLDQLADGLKGGHFTSVELTKVCEYDFTSSKDLSLTTTRHISRVLSK